MLRSLVVCAVTACAPTQITSETARVSRSEIPFSANPERGDRVSPGDKAIADGAPDGEFTITVQGPIAGIILTVCNDGAATSSHWDTFAGETALPAGFAWSTGKETWVLGVSDGAGLLNAADGSLPPLDYPTATTLLLSAADNGALAPGTLVCVWVIRPDATSLRASTLVP